MYRQTVVRDERILEKESKTQMLQMEKREMGRRWEGKAEEQRRRRISSTKDILKLHKEIYYFIKIIKNT